jgi:transcriptional regulator with XRE-family HTH domain
MTTGEKIRHFCTKKGLSQEIFAELLGISLQAYNKIETNKTKVDIERLQQIAEKLETNLVELLSYGESNIYYINSVTGSINDRNVGTVINNALPQDYLQLVEKVKNLEKDIAHLKSTNEALQKEVLYQTEIISFLKEKQK